MMKLLLVRQQLQLDCCHQNKQLCGNGEITTTFSSSQLRWVRSKRAGRTAVFASARIYDVPCALLPI
eukprot:2107308-Pleurochrysis_carterae.AAC.1